MNSPVQIRSAKESDVSGMSCLLSQLFSIESDFVSDEEKQRRGLTLLLDTLGAHIVVAESQGGIIGMATLQVLVSTAEGGYVGLVEDVVVDKEFRRKGVGAALLDYLHLWAQDNGLTRLQLAADIENRAALEFYASRGWKQTNLVMFRFSG